MSAREMDLARLQARCSEYLGEIAGLFKPGVKLTLLVRTPSHPDGSRNVVLTNDEVGAAIDALEISKGHREVLPAEANATFVGRPYSVERADRGIVRHEAITTEVPDGDASRVVFGQGVL